MARRYRVYSRKENTFDTVYAFVKKEFVCTQVYSTVELQFLHKN